MSPVLLKFSHIKQKDVNVYSLEKSERANLIKELPISFRLCYISLCRLKKYMNIYRLTGKECLEQFVLPDKTTATIISGDFGGNACIYNGERVSQFEK